jgi:hypothetical protein
LVGERLFPDTGVVDVGIPDLMIYKEMQFIDQHATN